MGSSMAEIDMRGFLDDGRAKKSPLQAATETSARKAIELRGASR